MAQPAFVHCELWQDNDSLSFFSQGDEAMRRLLSPSALLIWSCDARSWAEAQTLKHEHLGWEPYKPME
jgi:hypothetical protein